MLIKIIAPVTRSATLFSLSFVAALVARLFGSFLPSFLRSFVFSKVSLRFEFTIRFAGNRWRAPCRERFVVAATTNSLSFFTGLLILHFHLKNESVKERKNESSSLRLPSAGGDRQTGTPHSSPFAVPTHFKARSRSMSRSGASRYFRCFALRSSSLRCGTLRFSAILIRILWPRVAPLQRSWLMSSHRNVPAPDWILTLEA